MSESGDIPARFRELYDASGPVIRYRIVRDVLRRDTSFIETATMRLDLPKLDFVRALTDRQQLDGSWAGTLVARLGDDHLSTEFAVLRLCEWGLEDSDEVKACIEKSLLPTLLADDLIWEFETIALTEESRIIARRIIRDTTLRLLCRATRELDDLLKPHLELLLTEWEFYLKHLSEEHTPHASPILPPTEAGFAAVCWYPWSDDDFLRVQPLIARLISHAETIIGTPPAAPILFAPFVFALNDKAEFISQPQELFYLLELTTRLGVTRYLDVSRWLLEELEARQDADGWFRFDADDTLAESWYFPLEESNPEDHSSEWTFRAELIFSLLEFDL